MARFSFVSVNSQSPKKSGVCRFFQQNPSIAQVQNGLNRRTLSHLLLHFAFPFWITPLLPARQPFEPPRFYRRLFSSCFKQRFCVTSRHFDKVVSELSKGATLILYETGKADFNRFYSVDSKKACAHAADLSKDHETNPVPKGFPERAKHCADISEKFRTFGAIEKFFEECRKTMQLPYWTPTLSLPSGNYRRGFVEFMAGRFTIKPTPAKCILLKEDL